MLPSAAALRGADTSWSPQLWGAITFSVALHLLLLLIHFTVPKFDSLYKDQALDVILVNSRSAHKPTNAQALAQANLDGGGDVEEPRRASTPLPPSPQQVNGSDLEQAQRRIQQLESKQRELAAKASLNRKTAADRKQTEQRQATPTTNGLDLAESARAMARLEGEIARSLDEYNQRPRKKNIGTRTEEYRFARYIEDWRAKVERIGTLNYPQEARGKVYGSLILTVSVNQDGSVSTIDINRSSGYPVLDEAAVKIVRMGSPYSPFPPDIRRDIDILEITRTWSFTSSNELTTR